MSSFQRRWFVNTWFVLLAGCSEGDPEEGPSEAARASWALTVKVDGADVKLPLEGMDVFLVEDEKKYPEIFEITGPSVALVGEFPLAAHVESDPPPSPWIVDVAMAAVADDRWVTGLEKKNIQSAARLALAVLEEGDPIPRLCALLQDLSLGEFNRRDVLSRLYARPDPRAIPVLVKTIHDDPSGAVVNPAIEVLAGFRWPEAVDGLITCFDANFEGKQDWKRAFTPAMFRENVAASLRKLTGQDLPADRKRWEAWWQANRGSFRPR